MGWFGKLTFGSLGLFFGGPLGAIAGAVLGHHLIDKKQGVLARPFGAPQEPKIDYAEQTQAAYQKQAEDHGREPMGECL